MRIMDETRIRSRWFVTAAVVGGASFSVATLVSASSDQQDEAQPPRQPTPAEKAREVPPAAAPAALAAFELFRSGKTSPDSPALLGQPGEVRSLGRLGDGREVWASADSETICLYYTPRGAVGPGGSCDKAGAVAESGLVTSTIYADGSADVAALIPDGASDVNLKTEAGASAPTSSPNGVVSSTRVAPQTLSFTLRGRSVLKRFGG